MTSVEDRLTPFILAVSDLLREASPKFPHRAIQRVMDDAFDAEPSYNWAGDGVAFEFELLHPIPGWPTPADLEEWVNEGFALHPLIQWFARTGAVTPQTVGRVPAQLAPPSGHDYLRRQLSPLGLEEQLSIPIGLLTGIQHFFVLARGGRDFSDDDVALATRIQPLVALLDRQRQVIGKMSCTALSTATDCRLTGRELAVLRSLSQGLTAVSIARQLGSSPRTVHKHLEHAYRKLGVRDRLEAVRVADMLGLLSSRDGPPSSSRDQGSLRLPLAETYTHSLAEIHTH
jgi:DNA-binding CsgD family transcriptional regulator